LFIPTFYGVLFANESVGLFFWIGLVLFVVCLLLINIEPKKKSEQKPKIKITLKWIIYVLIGTVSNGITSILISLAGVQGEGATNGAIYDGIVFFMISCIIASIVTVIIALITEKDKIKQAKTGCLNLHHLAGYLQRCFMLQC
jgi:drug/metabolite transporter (DMT)-like permease